MTAPALARGQTGRRYVWPPGTDKPEMVVPSVTLILGQLAKPALINAAAKEVATFAVENILKWQDLPMRDAHDLLKRAPKRVWDVKRDLGSAVHKAIETVLKTWDGEEVVVNNMDLLPYVGAAVMYLQDHVAQLLHTETSIYNRTFQYAGTCDAIVILKDGRTAMVDWKSGSVWPEAALQLCAYANGEFIGHDDGTSEDLPHIDLGLVVQLPGDGTYEAREVELTARMWKTFQAARTVQKWVDDYAADAFGKKHQGSTSKVDEVAAKRQQKPAGAAK